MLLGAEGAVQMLRRGSSGAAVSALQMKLNGAGFSVGAVDGKFGPATDAAVRAFQSARGLQVDGIVGPETAGALGLDLPAATGISRVTDGVTSTVASITGGSSPPWYAVAAAGVLLVGGYLVLRKPAPPVRRNPRRRRRR